MNKGSLKISPLFLVFSLIIILIVSSLGVASLIVQNQNNDKDKIGIFESCSEISEYLAQRRRDYYYPVAEEDMVSSPSIDLDSGGNKSTNDFSETNVQVEGIDEADFVKTNGDYMYVLFEGVVTIFDVKDEANPQRVKDFYVGTNAYQLFLTNDSLVVFENDYGYAYYDYDVSYKYYNDTSNLLVKIYSIQNPSEPELQRELSFSGNFVTSRLVNNKIYLVASTYVDSYYNVDQIEDSLPIYKDSLKDEEAHLVSNCNEITYLGDSGSSFLTALEIPLNPEKEITGKVILGENPVVYMSQANLYLTSEIYEYSSYEQNSRFDLLPSPDMPPVEITGVSTEIIRIGLDKDEFKFEAVGEVPGRLHNQFSMDEYYGTLRLATTENDIWGWDSDSENSVFVLNVEDMKISGSVSGLGLGEEIRSARFIKDRLYLVTFRQIDPFYVIDLSNPSQPEVLGELKIPGFSGYLHPYDDTTVIGVGQDGDEFGRLSGVKVSMYDVSDVSNPQVKSEVSLGDERFSTSVLTEHKAFLFDKEKELLVIPVDSYSWSTGDSFNGFLIMKINDEGLEIRSEMDFVNDYYSYNKRSLYIGDQLITISGDIVRFNNLSNLELTNEFELK